MLIVSSGHIQRKKKKKELMRFYGKKNVYLNKYINFYTFTGQVCSPVYRCVVFTRVIHHAASWKSITRGNNVADKELFSNKSHHTDYREVNMEILLPSFVGDSALNDSLKTAKGQAHSLQQLRHPPPPDYLWRA